MAPGGRGGFTRPSGTFQESENSDLPGTQKLQFARFFKKIIIFLSLLGPDHFCFSLTVIGLARCGSHVFCSRNQNDT